MAENQQKPKILIVISNLEVGGGAQRVASTVGNELSDKGFETHLLTFYEYPQTYPYYGVYYSRHEKPKKFSKPIKAVMRVWDIAQYCKRHNIQTTVAFLEEASFYSILTKLFFNRSRIIVSVRNNPHYRNTLYKVLMRLLYPFADRVISVTRGIEEILKKDYKLTNTATIYNPIDKEMIEKRAENPLPEEFRWVENRTPLFISIGRLVQQKGQWHLVRAFQKVVEKNNDATLVLVGDGKLKDKLKKLIADCGLNNNVFLFGKQSNVFSFLKASDVFIFSSLWEGMPNTVLEALAVNLPVVTTDCATGPREIIAPELGIFENITYPYMTQYGILTMPLGFEQIWESSESCALTQEEKVFADAMIQILEKPLKDRLTGLKAFQMNSVIEQWCRVVSEKEE
ncbi:MAG: glycosyltransferase [Candidatus Paceibacterota bacterium]